MISKEIYDLLAYFEKSNLALLELSTDGMQIKLRKSLESFSSPVETVSMGEKSFTPVSAPAVKAPPVPSEEKNTVVTAPLVGLFYTSSSPERAPFVSVGDSVKKGDVIGLIESMKMFNDIVAPCDGTIVEICVDNETVVEYETPLFIIKDASHV